MPSFCRPEGTEGVARRSGSASDFLMTPRPPRALCPYASAGSSETTATKPRPLMEGVDSLPPMIVS